jgi:hypothetical protein
MYGKYPYKKTIYVRIDNQLLRPGRREMGRIAVRVRVGAWGMLGGFFLIGSFDILAGPKLIV